MFVEGICSSIICQGWNIEFQDRRRFRPCNPSGQYQQAIVFNFITVFLSSFFPLCIIYLSICYLSIHSIVHLSIYRSIIYLIKYFFVQNLPTCWNYLFYHGSGMMLGFWWWEITEPLWKRWHGCEGCQRQVLSLTGKCRRMPCVCVGGELKWLLKDWSVGPMARPPPLYPLPPKSLLGPGPTCFIFNSFTSPFDHTRTMLRCAQSF